MDFKVIKRFLEIAFVYVLIGGPMGMTLVWNSGKTTGYPFWPLAGICVLIILRWGYLYAFAVALGEFLMVLLEAHQLSSRILLNATSLSIACALAPVVVVFLLRKLFKFDESLRKLSDYFAFVMSASVGSVIAAIGCNFSIDIMLSPVDTIKRIYTVSSFWIGDTLGILLVAPLFFHFQNIESPKIVNSTRSLSFNAVLLLSLIISSYMGTFIVEPKASIVLVVVCSILIFWSASYFKVRDFLRVEAILAVISVVAFHHDLIPILDRIQDPSQKTFLFQCFLLISNVAITGFNIYCSQLKSRTV